MAVFGFENASLLDKTTEGAVKGCATVSVLPDIGAPDYKGENVVVVADVSSSMGPLFDKESDIGSPIYLVRKCLLLILNRFPAFTLILFSDEAKYAFDKDAEFAEKKLAIQKIKSVGNTNVEAAFRLLNEHTRASSERVDTVFFSDGNPTIGERDPNMLTKLLPSRNRLSTLQFATIGNYGNFGFFGQVFQPLDAKGFCFTTSEEIAPGVGAMTANVYGLVGTTAHISIDEGAAHPFPLLVAGDKIHIPYVSDKEQCVLTIRYTDKKGDAQCETHVLDNRKELLFAQDTEAARFVNDQHLKQDIKQQLQNLEGAKAKIRDLLKATKSSGLHETDMKEIRASIKELDPLLLQEPSDAYLQTLDCLQTGGSDLSRLTANNLVRQTSDSFAYHVNSQDVEMSLVPRMTRS